MNREYSRKIILNLLECGVQEFYICAGARDIPLIETVCCIQAEKQIVFNHFEERSAAFYALGRIKLLRKPVAVITTSGTAVGELLPAVMEAYYSNLPLILITADRPKAYRGTGAPQAAEQKNIFGIYVDQCLDLSIGDDFNFSNILLTKPTHLNVCFDIPLQSGIIEPIYLNQTLQNKEQVNITAKDISAKQELLKTFILNSKNLMVIVSQLNENNYQEIIRFLFKLNVPVLIESISNIRECEELEHLKIKCPYKLWDNANKSDFKIDGVLKIGGTPTHRVWRDIDEIFKEIKVFSISDSEFSGMPNAEHISVNLSLFFCNYNILNKSNIFSNKFLDLDKNCFLKLRNLIYKYPLSEQVIYYHLSNNIKIGSKIYLGNSLPIRNWDLTATYQNKKFSINASRGLNGIDGQISTFLGFSEESCTENWGFFGDLTAMYDMAAFWMLQHRQNLSINFVIINNNGGKIFDRVLTGDSSKLCQNTHHLNFKYLAKFWGLDYELHSDARNIKSSSKKRLIEITPHSIQTNCFSEELEN
jgi:2-succinyl-5-enolpyruvyl-6-hydroxy-3-cyclohexene-1-carboxylate synthase